MKNQNVVRSSVLAGAFVGPLVGDTINGILSGICAAFLSAYLLRAEWTEALLMIPGKVPDKLKAQSETRRENKAARQKSKAIREKVEAYIETVRKNDTAFDRFLMLKEMFSWHGAFIALWLLGAIQMAVGVTGLLFSHLASPYLILLGIMLSLFILFVPVGGIFNSIPTWLGLAWLSRNCGEETWVMENEVRYYVQKAGICRQRSHLHDSYFGGEISALRFTWGLLWRRQLTLLYFVFVWPFLLLVAALFVLANGRTRMVALVSAAGAGVHLAVSHYFLGGIVVANPAFWLSLVLAVVAAGEVARRFLPEGPNPFGKLPPLLKNPFRLKPVN